MSWFEARSALISVHDFQVTLAGYVVCIMFIPNLSVTAQFDMQAFGDIFGVGNIGVFYAISAWDYRVLSSREEGLFPVVDKSNFFQTFLQDQPVCWFGLRQTLLEMCLYEVSYLMVQYRKWVYNRKECMARAASYLIDLEVESARTLQSLLRQPYWSRWGIHQQLLLGMQCLAIQNTRSVNVLCGNLTLIFIISWE